MERVKRLLRIAIGSTLGVYLGKWLFVWWNYSAYPDLYALNSAPWYAQMLPSTGIAAGIVLTELLIFLLARQVIKGQESQ